MAMLRLDISACRGPKLSALIARAAGDEAERHHIMRVAQNLILMPVLAQVLLTIVVMVAMALSRRRVLQRRGQTYSDAATATEEFWDTHARMCANNYKNQFELPVLFYAACAFALITRQVDSVLLGLAVFFVASRIVHAYVHLTFNDIAWRGLAFIAGCVVLVAMWIILGWRVASVWL